MSDADLTDEADDPQWLLSEAGTLIQQGRFTLAAALLERCRELAQEQDDQPLLEAIAKLENTSRPPLASSLNTSIALFDQSRQSLVRGELTLASIGFVTGHALASTLNDESGDLPLYMGIGLMTAQAALGNAAAVISTGHRLLDIEEDEEPDEPSSANAVLRAALSAEAQGDHDTAEGLYLRLQHALEALTPYPGLEIERSKVLMNRGINFDSSGSPQEAEACFLQAQGLLDQSEVSESEPEFQALLHMNRAVTLSALEQYDESDRYAAKAQAIFDGLTDSASARSHAAVVRTQRGDNLRKQGQLLRAEELYEAASAAFAALPASEHAAQNSDLASLSLGRANNAMALGRVAEAEDLLIAAQQIYESLPEGAEKGYKLAGIHLNRAVAAQRQGRHAEAEARYRQAQELFDEVPGSVHVRTQRATVRMNRGDNLETMGLLDGADQCHEQAQALFDDLSSRYGAQSGSANVRINRANTLQSRGRHLEAEALYAEIDALLWGLPASLEKLEARTVASLNHGINLQALGHYDAAGEQLRAALQFLLAQDRSTAVRSMQGTILSNLANNASLRGQYGESEQAFAAAIDLYDALPDSEDSFTGRLLVRVNRLSNLLADRQLSSTAALWPDSFERLQALQGHSNANLPEAATVLMQALIELGEAALCDLELCVQRAMALCRWSLDWIDLVSDPLEPSPPGAEHVVSTFGLAMGWMLQSEQTDSISELLSEQFGRFAAAERLAGEDVASGTANRHPIAALRTSIRRLSGELQALESSLPAGNSTQGGARAMELLRSRRDTDVRALQAALRNQRQNDDAAARMSMAQVANAVRPTPDGTRRALAILFRYLVTVNDPTDPKPTFRVAAAALVVTPNSTSPKVVLLPDVVLDVAVNGRETLDFGSPSRPMYAAAAAAGMTRASHGQAPAASADGWSLRNAVKAGKEALWPAIGEVDEVFLATHHELGHLPWQSLGERQPVRVFHGVQLAVQELRRTRRTMPIAPPSAGRHLGVLAHSPAKRQRREATLTSSGWGTAIAGVYADRTVTRLQWPSVSETLEDKEALLQRLPALLQLSCHGTAREVHTGQAAASTSAYELGLAISALAPPSHHLEAVLMVSCASAQAGTNAFGEAGGWSVVLHGKVDAVLGALYPVDDLLCSLFILLLHRSWARTGDLRAALADTRARLRNGRWGDDAAEEEDVLATWSSALASAVGDVEPRSAGRLQQVLHRARDNFEYRHTLYLDDHRMRLVAESFVILG
ncbi:MAG: tetratricopeptide repeat protein [Candidatus Accumulibacter phosphatis]|nr:tetratricopeptide repeat protein [Candidatus Accumulibacter phosphatis]